MENWGLMIYDEAELMYIPGLTSVKREQRINIVMIHEVAHQVSLFEIWREQNERFMNYTFRNNV